MRVLAAFAFLLPLAACVTDDPAAGGYFGGKAGLMSGTYAKQTAEQQKQLEDEQDKKLRLERQYQDEQDKQASVKRDLTREEQRLAAVDKDIKAMQGQLAAARQKSSLGEAERRKLETELKDLELDVRLTQTTGGDSAAKRAKLADLEKRKKALEASLSAALKS